MILLVHHLWLERFFLWCPNVLYLLNGTRESLSNSHPAMRFILLIPLGHHFNFCPPPPKFTQQSYDVPHIILQGCSSVILSCVYLCFHAFKSLFSKSTHPRLILAKSGCLIPSDAKRGLCFLFCEGATSDSRRRMKNGLWTLCGSSEGEQIDAPATIAARRTQVELHTRCSSCHTFVSYCCHRPFHWVVLRLEKECYLHYLPLKDVCYSAQPLISHLELSVVSGLTLQMFQVSGFRV